MSSPISLSDLLHHFELYKKMVSSEVLLPALVFGPVEGAGAVLSGLRGACYVKRGVHNVLDVWVDHTDEGPVFYSAGGKDEEEQTCLKGVAEIGVGEGASSSSTPLASSASSRKSSSFLPSSKTATRKRYKLFLLDPNKVTSSIVTPDFIYDGNENNVEEEEKSLHSPNEKSSRDTRRVSGPSVTTVLSPCHLSLGPFSSLHPPLLHFPLDIFERLKKIVEENEKRLQSSSSSASTASPSVKWEFSVTSVKVFLTYKNYTMPELLQLIFTYPFSCNSVSSLSCAANDRDSSSITSSSSTLSFIDSSPHALGALSGFEQVGHIAHLNLRKAYLPFQYVIAKVLLDCNPSVDVVVNKVESIASVFREFKMDLIGYRYAKTITELTLEISPSKRASLLLATVRQHNCDFRIPYDAVYWNTRLCHEHQRLIDLLQPGDVLLDVMAGVGPFAVPAAVKGVEVHANDLNPTATQYLEINAKLNRASHLHAYNLDGRVFLNTVVYEYVMRRLYKKLEGGNGLSCPSTTGRTYPEDCSPVPSSSSRDPVGKRECKIHVIMNLPAIAVEFLDVFSPQNVTSPWRKRVGRGAVSVESAGSAANGATLPFPFCDFFSSSVMAVENQDGLPWLLFHVYCFSSATDVVADAVKQISHHLGYPLQHENNRDVLNVVVVRSVAPKKKMMCVSFTLPEAFWTGQKEDEERKSKTQRSSTSVHEADTDEHEAKLCKVPRY